MTTPTIAGLHFECGECGHRAVRRLEAHPDPEELEVIRRRAVCSKCGGRGRIEPLWTGNVILDVEGDPVGRLRGGVSLREPPLPLRFYRDNNLSRNGH